MPEKPISPLPEAPAADAKVKSLGKALSILNCFLDKPSLGVVEIARQLSLNKSNVSDVLATFEAMGYLHQDEQTGKFRLGLKMLRFAHTIATGMGYHQYVYPVMQETADALGETVYFGVPDRDEVMYLDGAFPAQSVHNVLVRAMAGDHAPMYCTGIGKAMLAFLPRDQWEACIPAAPAPFTEFTLVERGAIMRELETVRLRGYSVDNMEHEFGIKCVGVPVMNQYGRLVAGMSVSGPSLRFDEVRIEYIAKMLIEKARQLSQLL